MWRKKEEEEETKTNKLINCSMCDDFSAVTSWSSQRLCAPFVRVGHKWGNGWVVKQWTNPYRRKIFFRTIKRTTKMVGLNWIQFDHTCLSVGKLQKKKKDGHSRRKGKKKGLARERKYKWMNEWMNEWLTDSQMNWLSNWLTIRLTNWLMDWLIDWLTDWLTGWLIDWLMD